MPVRGMLLWREVDGDPVDIRSTVDTATVPAAGPELVQVGMISASRGTYFLRDASKVTGKPGSVRSDFEFTV
jgi:hypothetical protein